MIFCLKTAGTKVLLGHGCGGPPRNSRGIPHSSGGPRIRTSHPRVKGGTPPSLRLDVREHGLGLEEHAVALPDRPRPAQLVVRQAVARAERAHERARARK